MLDSLGAFLAMRWVTAVCWVVLGLVVWVGFPRRYRFVAVSAGGALLGLATGAVFEVLRSLGGSIAGGLAEAAFLFATFTLFLAPPTIALDRIVRRPLRSMVGDSRFAPYALATATGLAACLASFVALWWVTDVHPQLEGSLEVALYGGVATACLGLVRADRAAESRDGIQPRRYATGESLERDAPP